MTCGRLREVDTFVGRLDELSVLAGIRARALDGRRQAVVLAGEAGVGKTWLCERASELAEREGFEVVRGRCWPHGGAPALWPWPALLPALTGEAGARLLASDAGGDVVGAERFARFAAVADLLATTRRNIPTMIVIDDVHYADASTLLLTRFLVHSLDRLPLVLLLATRPGAGADELLTELQRDATTVTLRPFGLEDSAALLSAHGLRDADDETVKVLLDMTGGNPLHLAQAARTGASHVTAENAIAGAIGRLGPRVQRILAFAALLGVDGTASEVAVLADTTQTTVVQALASSGLLQQGHDGLRFHDLVREAALAVFSHGELLDAHANAAKLLSGSTERVAHHAFAAAHRSTADAEFAITACRNAASSLRRGYAYEQAAVLLDRAVELGERVHTLASRAELLIERADAVLACGRLTDARAAYELAAEAAELSGDPVLLARAVLGLGGIWVHQYRNDTVRKRVLAQQRAALRALPEHERGLRCLLKVRLAAEAYYEGGPVQAVLDALAETRASGDEHALAEALSLTHHAMLAPEHAVERMALAEEQIVAASAAGDGMLALVGLLWLTADRYLLGEPDAERSLTELRQQSAALGVATTAYLVTCMDVMHLIRAGRLADAEDAASACFQRGVDVGDADAPGYYGAQLLTIRWFQGRVGELAELVMNTLASTDLAKPEYGFRASAVLILARDGRLTEARATLAPLLDIGVANLQSTSSWLTAMVGLIEAAAVLEDPDLAGQVADLIRPFAEMPVMPSLATSCFGAASRAIGLAELTMGNAQQAVTYLEQAISDNLRLGNRPAVALSSAQLAEALIARGRPGDLTRARELLCEASDDARKMDMSQRADAWQAQAAELVPPDVPVVLRRSDGGWTVHVGQAEIALPDMIGFHYLGLLLDRPGHDIPAFDLCGRAILETRPDLLLDPAVTAFRSRLRDLDDAINSADTNADLASAERLRLEREAVTSELTASLGRVRGFPDSPERARTSVRKALKRALDVIAEADPVLGEQLRTSISTGYVCRFSPVGPVSRQWRFERP